MSRATRDAAARRELAITAYHEAGHAVVSIAIGAPMYGVWIKVSRPLFGQPAGYGKTKLSRHGGTFVKDEQMEAIVVVQLAGAEAEAMYLHTVEGVSIRNARRQSAAHNRDEIQYAEALLHEHVQKGATQLRTLGQAEAVTAHRVLSCWPAINRLARELIRRPSLGERDVRRIVGRVA